MKRVFNFALIVLLVFSFGMLRSVDKAIVSSDEYQFNSPDWSEEEFRNFYIDNNIFPANPPIGTDVDLFSEDIPGHLKGRFPGYSWTKSNKSSDNNTVASTFGGVPVETDEDDRDIQNAKSVSEISDYDFIGCGPLSLITQLDFLARYAGYTQLAPNIGKVAQKNMLNIDIFNGIQTYPSNGELAADLKLMGIELSDGTFTFPHDFINGTNQLLLDYNITNGIGSENVRPDGTYEKMIKVSGDKIPSTSSKKSKIDRLVKSIDEGMPVIWWTLNNAGQNFGNHFMNIFGYEKWIGTSSSGEPITHLMFKLRMNWGREGYRMDTYMDSDLLSGVTGGFIIFEEEAERIVINPEDYGFPQQYHYNEISKTLNINGNSIKTKRKRTGYINEKGINGQDGDGAWHITMSANRVGAGSSYLEYTLERPINFIYFDIRQWGPSEGTNSNRATVKLEYKNASGIWIESIDFLNQNHNIDGFSSLKDYPDKYRADFPYGTKTFRFISTFSNPTNTNMNKGRIVIGTVGIVFDSNDPSDSDLFVTLFSNNNGGSSSFNTSGHAWLQIYNNSPNSVMVGKYLLPAFEGITLGTYGNKTHKGVYYNLEYFGTLQEARTASSGSSGSSSGSSGSWSSSWGSIVGSSSDSGGSSAWSAGSFGASSWFSSTVYDSLTLGYQNGRVSLTEIVHVSYAALLTNTINDKNDKWTIFYNCTDFAIDVWNRISTNTFDKNLIQTPTNLMKQIQKQDDFQTDRYIYGNNYRVGYFKENDFIYSTT